MSHNRNNNNAYPPLADDEESYYSEEEVTCTEDDDDDDFEYKELEKEIYGRMGGPPPDVVKAMGKQAPSAKTEPQKRPPHPMMSGAAVGAGRNALMDQIKARGATPASAEATSIGKENVHLKAITTSTPVKSTPSPQTQRPPHPLMGGGGGNSALLDQIKARGAEPPTAQGSGTGKSAMASSSTPKETPKSAAPTPPPPKKPLASMSMAEQVALMAKKRQERLEASEASNSQAANDDENEPQQDTPVSKTTSSSSKIVEATPASQQPYTKPTITATMPKKEDSTKKSRRSGGFFGEKKTELTTQAPTSVAADTKPAVGKSTRTSKTPAVSEVSAKNDAEEVTIIKTYKPDPLPLPSKPTVPVFAQAKLKPVTTTTVTTKTDDENVAAATPAVNATGSSKKDGSVTLLEETAPAKVTTTTTTTTIVTKTKRITRSDPEYDVTEYKVGCACNVM